MEQIKIYENTYNWLSILFVFLYSLTLFGIWSEAPRYLKIVTSLFHILVGSIIIYYFNPFTKTKCTSFHRRVMFSAGVAIILQKSIVQYLNPSKIVSKLAIKLK